MTAPSRMTEDDLIECGVCGHIRRHHLAANSEYARLSGLMLCLKIGCQCDMFRAPRGESHDDGVRDT